MAYQGLSVLAVVPARGGSKGIYKKNLREIDGLSLIAHAGDLLQEIPWVDQKIISTDDLEMQEEGIEHGLSAPFLRSAEIATDESSSKDVLKDAWQKAEEYFARIFDICLLIEPTSPLRERSDVEATIKALIDLNASAALTVSQTPAHYTLEKSLLIDEEGSVSFRLETPTDFSIRQRIQAVYHRNGLCYAFKRRQLFDYDCLIERDTVAVISDREIVNIDTEFDLKLAGWLFDEKKKA